MQTKLNDLMPNKGGNKALSTQFWTEPLGQQATLFFRSCIVAIERNQQQLL